MDDGFLLDVEAVLAAASRDAELGPIGLALARGDGASALLSVGWDADRPVHIWSTSKWLTSATVLAVVERGGLSLDASVSDYMPTLAMDPLKRRITLRHCLSLTSGLAGSHPSIMDPSISLRDSVEAIVGDQLAAPPGTELSYGGNGFQVAGLVCQEAIGRPFTELFDELVAQPLGMARTTFGESRNPWLGGGAHSSLSDLQKFVAAQLPDASTSVLSEPFKREMRLVQTAGTKVGFSPYPDSDRQYGLGLWLDDVDDAGYGTLASCQGAAGCTPWLDEVAGLGGCLLMEAHYLAAYPVYRELAKALRSHTSRTPTPDAAPRRGFAV